MTPPAVKPRRVLEADQRLRGRKDLPPISWHYTADGTLVAIKNPLRAPTQVKPESARTKARAKGKRQRQARARQRR